MIGKFLCQRYHVKRWWKFWKNGSIKASKVYSGHWWCNRRTAKWCKKNQRHQKCHFGLESVWKTWCQGMSIIKVLEIKEHIPVKLSRLYSRNSMPKWKTNMIFWHFLPTNFVMFIYYYWMVIIWLFSFNLELICTHQSSLCNFSFSKTHSPIELKTMRLRNFYRRDLIPDQHCMTHNMVTLM